MRDRDALNKSDLEGQVVLVTGGSRGIGREIVIGAAARGARVVFCARTIGQQAQQVKTQAQSLNPDAQVIAMQGDVTQESDVARLFDTTLQAFGRVDVAINNAGMYHDNLLISMPTEGWDDVMAANLTGAFLVARRAIQEFLAHAVQGRIVSISSIAQNGATSNASYAASKGGLVGLMRSIAKEYGHMGIRAFTVVSGFVETDLTRNVPPTVRHSLVEMSPQGRPAKGSEIAAMALFLASRRARVANGEPIYVSGGLVDAPRYVAAEKHA